ncbi:hypothetical protein DFJ74DRAFT_704014 [Hyaloraphidium curvatum]|nr:hypothetical protein DFJ74DRAFT_704014 [Hyaloraphidium curvatum]
MAGLKGKNILVTGGTEGIGLALVDRLLSLGVRVVIANRNAEAGAKVVKELAEKHWDLLDRTSIDAAFRFALDKLGSLDAVVANSGFVSEVNYLRDIAKPDAGPNNDRWLAGIEGNLVGNISLATAALRYWLRAGREGVLVITGSVDTVHLNRTTKELNSPIAEIALSAPKHS